MTEELVDPVPGDFNIGIPLSPCRAVEEAPVDLDEPETRPLPALPPAALLNGLSSLWRYPWKGLDAMESVLDELSTNESLKGYAGKLDALKNDLAAYNDPDETIVGADAVQLEYTRMFIGSFRMYAPPYASYYMDGEGQMYGPTAVAVEDLYAQFGLEIKLDEHDMPSCRVVLLGESIRDSGAFAALGGDAVCAEDKAREGLADDDADEGRGEAAEGVGAAEEVAALLEQRDGLDAERAQRGVAAAEARAQEQHEVGVVVACALEHELRHEANDDGAREVDDERDERKLPLPGDESQEIAANRPQKPACSDGKRTEHRFSSPSGPAGRDARELYHAGKRRGERRPPLVFRLSGKKKPPRLFAGEGVFSMVPATGIEPATH